MAGVRGQDQGQAGINVNAQLQSRGQNDAYATALQGYGMHAADQNFAGRTGYATAQNNFDYNTQLANAQLQSGKNAEQTQQQNAAIGAGASAAAAGAGLALMFSDKRAKKEIKDGRDSVGRFLKTLKPYDYEYKDKAHGEGKKTSVMAQDLEKTSLGETLVSRHKSGLRQVDYAKALPIMLASLGHLSERIDKAEARR